MENTYTTGQSNDDLSAEYHFIKSDNIDFLEVEIKVWAEHGFHVQSRGFDGKVYHAILVRNFY